MDLGPSERVKPLIDEVHNFIHTQVMPVEEEYFSEIENAPDRWQYTPRMTEILEGLKTQAREKGLWNLWLTDSQKGRGLATVEYAYLAEEMGWSALAAEAFNCSAPDTGNMEVMERYGS